MSSSSLSANPTNTSTYGAVDEEEAAERIAPKGEQPEDEQKCKKWFITALIVVLVAAGVTVGVIFGRFNNSSRGIFPETNSSFLIRQNLLGFGDDYTIQDASSGQTVYKVDGKALSIGDELSFQDAEGNELLAIEQEVVALKPRFRYFLLKDGEKFATVTQARTVSNKQFILDVPGSDTYTIQGSFFNHDFYFIRGGKRVVQVSKSYFSLTDSYAVRIQDGEDVEPILASCIVIDLVVDDSEN